MKKYETRTLTEDAARGFLNNMRWFAGMGRISIKKISEDRWKVRATPGAFSHYIFTPEDYK